MNKRFGLAAVIAVAAPAASSAALAQDDRYPVIAGYGAITPLESAANRPASSDDMRVLFEVTGDATGPSKVNRSLDRVARYLNLLASAGNTPAPGEVKVIIHGPATPLVMADGAYRDRFGSDNPNTALVAALQNAGVDIHVCGQALAGQNIAFAAVNSAIKVDLSAMTTLVLLQQQGWPVVSD